MLESCHISYTYSDFAGVLWAHWYPMLARKTMASMAGAPAKLCEARLEDFGDGKAGNHGGHQLGVSKRSNIGHCTPKIAYAKSSKIKLFGKSSSKLKWPWLGSYTPYFQYFQGKTLWSWVATVAISVASVMRRLGADHLWEAIHSGTRAAAVVGRLFQGSNLHGGGEAMGDHGMGHDDRWWQYQLRKNHATGPGYWEILM